VQAQGFEHHAHDNLQLALFVLLQALSVAHLQSLQWMHTRTPTKLVSNSISTAALTGPSRVLKTIV